MQSMELNFSLDQRSQASNKKPTLKLNVIRDLLRWRFDELECKRIMKELEKFKSSTLTFN